MADIAGRHMLGVNRQPLWPQDRHREGRLSLACHPFVINWYRVSHRAATWQMEMNRRARPGGGWAIKPPRRLSLSRLGDVLRPDHLRLRRRLTGEESAPPTAWDNVRVEQWEPGGQGGDPHRCYTSQHTTGYFLPRRVFPPLTSPPKACKSR